MTTNNFLPCCHPIGLSLGEWVLARMVCLPHCWGRQRAGLYPVVAVFPLGSQSIILNKLTWHKRVVLQSYFPLSNNLQPHWLEPWYKRKRGRRDNLPGPALTPVSVRSTLPPAPSLYSQEKEAHLTVVSAGEKEGHRGHGTTDCAGSSSSCMSCLG